MPFDAASEPGRPVQQAQEAASEIASAVVSAGDPRKVEVTCLATGEIQGIKIATTYLSSASPDELGATLRDTLRAGQEAAADRRAEATAKVLTSLDELTQNLARSMSTMSDQLADVVSNFNRLTFGGK
ncbi:hypothetical protein GCM10023317_71830 [Actinopolymorpha pittospori]|uniref:DNA-binding protein YbaB n=2 Tax=Actinopolymorpha pittospori TaxID=648752 RepID=A0A927NAW2_9ACTN|nr:DNA-binding protein YbaB [Actinopolymorpha pittospori]